MTLLAMHGLVGFKPGVNELGEPVQLRKRLLEGTGLLA
jgi:hypothetical protein